MTFADILLDLPPLVVSCLQMADRIIYEYTNDPLTPKMEKLKAERLKLAQWARRLGAQGQPRAEGEKPVVGKGTSETFRRK